MKRRRRTLRQPTVKQLETELARTRRRSRTAAAVRNTLFLLVTVAAAAVLVATLLLPVLRIFGDSMEPTLNEREIVVALKGKHFSAGDIVAFYYNNKVLVKRVIGTPGDWVDIREDGTVYVNDARLEEPYITEKAFGICDVQLPYQVPEGQYFVMGDQRATSVDSRASQVGCVAQEEIIGKIAVCVLPVTHIRIVK